MAHLKRCHCGRVFRCDQDHPAPRVRHCSLDGDAERTCSTRCPDRNTPGHDPNPVVFGTVIVIPKVMEMPTTKLFELDHKYGGED